MMLNFRWIQVQTRQDYRDIIFTMFNSGGLKMIRHSTKMVASLSVLLFVFGCQPKQDEQMKSDMEQLKQQITQLTEDVKKINDNVEKIDKVVFKPKYQTLPNQDNVFSDEKTPSLGSSDAKIAIVEFSDFQCPYCKRFSDNTFDQLKTNYIDTGKVKYIARDFPLSFHPQAKGAAVAALCSFQQDAYWPMRALLFNNVKQLGNELYQQSASELELDKEKFDNCLSDQDVMKKVEQDMALGSSLGVRGTPSFLVGKVENGQLIEPQLVVGAQQYAVFAELLDSLDDTDKKE